MSGARPSFPPHYNTENNTNNTLKVYRDGRVGYNNNADACSALLCSVEAEAS